MALGRLALHAQQCARFLRREVEHLCTLRDRFRKLELAGVNSLHIFVSPGPGRGPAFGGRAQGLQVDIFDADFAERQPERRLRKAGASRQRQGANVDYAFDAGILQRGEKLVHRRALVTDGEDLHASA